MGSPPASAAVTTQPLRPGLRAGSQPVGSTARPTARSSQKPWGANRPPVALPFSGNVQGPRAGGDAFNLLLMGALSKSTCRKIQRVPPQNQAPWPLATQPAFPALGVAQCVPEAWSGASLPHKDEGRHPWHTGLPPGERRLCW